MKRTRVAALGALLWGIALVAAPTAAGAAIAQVPAEYTPTIVATPDTVAPGAMVGVEVRGWAPDANVVVQLSSIPMCSGDCGLPEEAVLEQQRLPTGSDGFALTQFLLPRDVPAGVYYVSAFGPPLAGTVQTTVTVEAVPVLAVDVPATGAGGTVVVTGENYPFDEVWLSLTTASNVPWYELGQVAVVDGAFRQEVAIPADVAPGSYELWARNGVAVPAVANLVVLPGTGEPEPEPEPEPEAEASTGVASAAQGGRLAVTGTGFLAGELVRIELHSTPVVLTTVSASADGSVAATVSIPAATEPQEHTIVLIGETSGRTAATPLTVTPGTDDDDESTPAPTATDQKRLAATGGSGAAPIAALAGAASVLGGVGLLLRRRRGMSRAH